MTVFLSVPFLTVSSKTRMILFWEINFRISATQDEEIDPFAMLPNSSHSVQVLEDSLQFKTDYGLIMEVKQINSCCRNICGSRRTHVMSLQIALFVLQIEASQGSCDAVRQLPKDQDRCQYVLEHCSQGDFPQHRHFVREHLHFSAHNNKALAVLPRV